MSALMPAAQAATPAVGALTSGAPMAAGAPAAVPSLAQNLAGAKPPLPWEITGARSPTPMPGAPNPLPPGPVASAPTTAMPPPAAPPNPMGPQTGMGNMVAGTIGQPSVMQAPQPQAPASTPAPKQGQGPIVAQTQQQTQTQQQQGPGQKEQDPTWMRAMYAMKDLDLEGDKPPPPRTGMYLGGSANLAQPRTPPAIQTAQMGSRSTQLAPRQTRNLAAILRGR